MVTQTLTNLIFKNLLHIQGGHGLSGLPEKGKRALTRSEKRADEAQKKGYYLAENKRFPVIIGS